MDKKITKNSFLDLSILIPYLILSAVGLLMVFSATVPYQINRGLSPYRLAISKGVFIIISFVALIIIYRVKLRIIKNEKILKIIFLIIILLMIYSRVGPNTSANGAHGWIPLPGIGTIQPVEFAKLFTVWFLASIFSNKQEEIEKNDIQAIFKGNNLVTKVVGGAISDYITNDCGTQYAQFRKYGNYWTLSLDNDWCKWNFLAMVFRLWEDVAYD